MSRRMTDTFSWAIHFLLGPVCKSLIRPQQRLSLCAPPSLPLSEKCIHNMGAFLQAQLRGKTEIVFAAASCVWIVHWVSPFSSFDWNGPVQFDRSEEGRKKYLNTMKTKGLAVSKSALCLVQFKSKDNQECLFDNSIYNALFWSPEPPKQRQIGFKQVI